MPAKLDQCVQQVMDQGKDKNSAYAICSNYAICSKSTHWVKAGKHSWRKKKKIQESFCSKGAIARIEQIIEEASDYLSEYRNGVYSAVSLDPTALQKLQKYLKGVGIEMAPLNKIHVTVIYSRSRPQKQPQAFDINGYVTPKSFGIFGKGTSAEPYVLVLEVDSPELQQAHIRMKREYGIKYTYSEYKPHITLTYDINRVLPGLKKLRPKQKKTIINIFNKMIPELPQKIRILKHTVKGI